MTNEIVSEDLRLERARYAVELHAYYGQAACSLSDEQVATYLDLLEEYDRRMSFYGNNSKHVLRRSFAHA